ncbi:hypothetical protein C5S35_10555 [Candidatus Methanophagaceae archaeon]|nr:hypothetical protein C5S35_10555 [Methanophagales archaeon]
MNKPKEGLSQAAKPAGLFGRVSARLMAIVHRTRADGYWLALDGAYITGQDMVFDQGFIADSTCRAGFKSVRSHTLEMPVVPVDRDIRRK